MKRSWRIPFLWLLVCLFACLAFLIYPIYVIRPFRHQGPRELLLALQVLRFRPAAVLTLAILTTGLSALTWKRMTRIIPRLGVALLALLMIGFASLSFVNVYEVMFHPLRRPTFKSTSTTHLDGGEQVIAVKLGSSARAYPIRIISYHHIVNDMLAGLPIVATY